MEEKFKKAFQKIKEAKNILLITHVRPDGDALASVCALVDLLESSNKKYLAFCVDKPTPYFYFLPNLEKIKSNQELLNFSNFDLIIILDCGSISRTGLKNEIMSKNNNQFIVEFDHHPKTEDYSDLEIRDPKAASTTEILYYFFKINKIKFNKQIANCILTGILTDTSNFLHQSTSKKSIEIASKMMLCGAQLPQITQLTNRNKSVSAMKLWGLVLKNLKINKKYNFAFVALTLNEIKKYETDEEIFEGISNFLINIKGVKAVMFLREEINKINGLKQIKGSLRRCQSEADLAKLANHLGGGGHKQAAGFVVDGQLEKAGKSWKVV